MATFYIPVENDQVAGHTPEDYPERNYASGHPFAAEHFVTVYNGRLWRTNFSGIFRPIDEPFDTIVHDSGSKLEFNSDGDCILTAEGATRIKSAGAIKMFYPHDTQLLIFGATCNFKVDVKTVPSGTGLGMYSDNFIEYSSAAHKTEVSDIQEVENKIKSLKARRYRVAGKERFGLIAEENPLVQESWVTDEGKRELGINWGSVLGLLLKIAQNLITRVEKLEKGAAR